MYHEYKQRDLLLKNKCNIKMLYHDLFKDHSESTKYGLEMIY